MKEAVIVRIFLKYHLIGARNYLKNVLFQKTLKYLNVSRTQN